MAKSLNDLVFSIKEAVSNFEITDDSPFSDSWIADQIITQNHTLIRKALKERSLDKQIYQLHEPLEVKPMDKSFFIGEVEIKNNPDLCYVDTPNLITGLRGMEIDFVSNASYSVIYTRSSLRRMLRPDSGYYTTGKPKYAPLPKKLIFQSNKVALASYVAINAIWADPREVSSWDPDDKFPTPSEKNLEILTIQHIAHAMNFPMDLQNNAQRAVAQPEPVKDEGN